MSIPIKRKTSAPIIVHGFRAQSPQMSSPTNSQLLQNTSNNTPAYPASKRVVELSRTSSIREEDSVKASAGASTRLSLDLPKLFFLKSLQNSKQNAQMATLNLKKETSLEGLNISNSQIVVNTEAQAQAQLPKQSQAVSKKIIRFNPQKGVHRQSLKSYAVCNNSKEETQSILTDNSSEAQTRKVSIEPNEGKPILHLKIRKAVEESDKKRRMATKVVDIRTLVKKSLHYQPPIIKEIQPTQLKEVYEEHDNGLRQDLTNGNIIKDELGVLEKIKVYKRHKDIASHFNRSMSKHILSTSVVTRNNSFSKKFLQEYNDGKEKSLDQKSHVAKSHSKEAKRKINVSTGVFTVVKETRNRLKETVSPTSFLDKSHLERNNSSSSMALLDNLQYTSIGMDFVSNINTQETPLEFFVKSRTMKERSPTNLFNLVSQDDKQKNNESIGELGTLADLDSKPQEQDPKPFKKLESYFKVATRSELDKEKTNYRNIRDIKQQSVLKGTSANLSLLLKVLPQETEEVHNKITSLVQRVGQYHAQKIRRASQQEESASKAGLPEILDELGMQAIRDEYRKRMTHPETVDYERIDSMILRLDFFAKLSKTVRMTLLQKSHLLFYTAGSKMLKKGDNVDQMYVILRGSINVKALKITPNGKKEYLTIAVLRDGDHFGEYTIMGAQAEAESLQHKICIHMGTLDLETGEENAPTKQQAYIAMKKKPEIGYLDQAIEEWALNDQATLLEKVKKDQPKRTAIIEVAESCDLLCIARNQFQAIFLDLIQTELDAKLKLLLCLPCFHQMDPFGLIPLASILVSRVYTMGDVIMPAGIEVDRMFIVSQGRCKITLRSLLEVDPEMSEKYFQKQPASHPTPSSEAKLKRSTTKLSTKLSLDVSMPNGKVYDQDAFEVKDGKLFYIENIIYGTLARGDIIGGRALISEADITDMERRNGKVMYLGPSRLSVVADSPMVEVFEIDRTRAATLSDHLRNILKNGIKRTKQFDDYEISKEKREHEEWAKFKEKEMKYIVRAKTKVFEGEVKPV